MLLVLVGLLSLCPTALRAQVFINGTPTSAAANSVNTCEANPAGVFNVGWSATGTATNPRITVKVPGGVSLLSATAATGTRTITATQAGGAGTLITLAISGPLAAAETGSIDFKLTYSCNAIAGFTAPNVANLEFTPFSNENTANPKASVAIGNTMSIPVVQLNAGTNGTYTTAKRSVPFARTFLIKQTGQKSKLDSFNLCMTYDANQAIANRRITVGAATATLPAAPAATTQQCLTISRTLYPTLPWPFKSDGTDDVWTYGEDVTVTTCGSTYGTQVTANYGCGTAACQTVANYNMTVAVDANLRPQANSALSLTPVNNSCITEGYTVLATHTLFAGEFTNLTIRPIADGQNSYIDRTTIRYRLDGGAWTNVPSASLTSVTASTGCNPNGIREARFATGLNVDAKTVTHTFAVEYVMRMCCPAAGACNKTIQDLLGTRHLLETQDHCAANFTFTAQRFNQSIAASTSDQVPGYLADGQTGTWRHDINAIGNLGSLPGSFQVCANFTVDQKIVVAVANGLRWHNPSGTLSQTAPITNLGGGNYQSCFTNRFWEGGGSKLYYDASYACAASPTSTCGTTASSSMKMGVRLGTAACAENASGSGACVFAFLCEDGATTLGDQCCPGAGGCNGITHTGITVERTCFGAWDANNDGTPDGTTRPAGVRTERAMQGDELAFRASGRVNASSITPINDVYFELTFPTAHEIGGTATFTVQDVSAGATYACAVLNAFAVTPLQTRYFLTAKLLRGCGTFPADFAFENGDLLTLDGTFVNLDNGACGVKQVDIAAEWYADLSKQGGSARARCNLPLPIAYSQVSYNFSANWTGQNNYGCVGAQFDYRADFCIGGGSFGTDPFPYEIRTFGKPLRSGLKVPTGLSLEVLEMVFFQGTRAQNQTDGLGVTNVTALAKIIDGFVVLDYKRLYDTYFGGRAPNGGYQLQIRAKFGGTCASAPSKAAWYYEAEKDFCAPTLTDETYRFAETRTTDLPISPPRFAPEATAAERNIFPTDPQANWTFRIAEKNNRSANQIWLMAKSKSGAVIPLQVRANGTLITPNKGIYQLGSRGANSTTTIQLKADYKLCPKDSIRVYVGWDCSGYPASDQQVLQGGLPCPVETLDLYLTPKKPDIQQAIIVAPPAEVLACTSFDYQLEVKNVTDAVLYEPKFELYLPYTSGVEIDPTTALACYPCGATPPAGAFTHALNAPTEVIITPLGVKYIWDLEARIPAFNFALRKGWPGSLSANADSTRIGVKFKAKTNCNHVGGDFLNFVAKGHNYCGDRAESILRNGAPLFIQGVPRGYNGVHVIDDPAPINGCANGAAQRLKGTFLFLADTDGLDTLVIALPPGLAYRALNFNPAHLVGPPRVRRRGPVGGTSFDEVRVRVAAGLKSATTIPWEVEVNVDQAAVLCAEPNALYVRTVRSATVTCNGTPCASAVANSTAYPPPLIRIKTDSIRIDEFRVSANCAMNVVTVDRIKITNVGLFNLNTDIQVDFYHDADNSFTYTPGDVLVGSTTLPQDLARGASATATAGPFTVDATRSCKIIAVAKGCNCYPVQAYANSIRSNNAGPDQAGCANSTFPVGCGADLRPKDFTYQWFGLNGAPTAGIADAANPNTTIAFTNFSETAAKLNYVLVTTHPAGACNSVDTVQLTFAGTKPLVGNTLTICPDATGSLSGPQGFFDYQWSPTTGLANPLSPTTQVTAPTGAVEYTLTYKTLEGCGGVFRQKVRGATCTDLELTKRIASAPTGVNSVVTYEIEVVNKGPNGASGVLVSDTLPQNLSFLNAEPAGQYNPATSTWTIPGILLPDDRVKLTMYARVTKPGIAYNVAEIRRINEGDTDSTPGNNKPGEDDQQGVCTQAPIALECRQTRRVGVPKHYTIYQWFRDGTAIAGATKDSLDISLAGTYTVKVNGTQDPYGVACPLVVTKAPCASIGDFVWEDLNANGQQDTGEPGLANVKVYLYDATTGLKFDSATTSSTGAYVFTQVPSRSLYVQVLLSTLPQNPTSGVTYSATVTNTGAAATDSDVQANGRTATFAFDAAAGNRTDLDAGFVPRARLGDYVWIDANRNGVQDLGEAPVVGATVKLLNATTGATLGTTTTNAAGRYFFTNVSSASYRVAFDYKTASAYANYAFTQTGAGTMATDSDASRTTGESTTFAFDARNGDDLTWDAGIFAQANIGDQIFADANGDGIRQVSETGVASVTVRLFDAGGNVVATTTTDATGKYLFANQPSGTYSIGVDFSTATGGQPYAYSPRGTVGTNDNSQVDPATGRTAPFGFDASLGNDLRQDAGLRPVGSIGDRVFADLNRDGLQNAAEGGVPGVTVQLINATTNAVIATTVSDATGAYVFANQTAGSYRVAFNAGTATTGLKYLFSPKGVTTGLNDGTDDSNVNPATGSTDAFTFDPTASKGKPGTKGDFTIDAGAYPVAQIGNFVWLDSNNDGLQTTGEPGINAVTVRLYDANTNAVVQTRTTNASGAYAFLDVPAGRYYVGFDKSTAANPAALSAAKRNAGTGTNDSDADAAGFTAAFNFDPAGGNDLSWDAGFIGKAGIGDFVWVDTNGDGIQQASEKSIPGITVKLYTSTGALVGETTTEANGKYFFPGATAGNYYLTFDASTSAYGKAYAFMPALVTTAGATTANDSDASQPVSGSTLAKQTAVFAFDASADNFTYDAAIQPEPAIEAVKRVLKTTNRADGNIDVTYQIGVRNTGPTALSNVSLRDDLRAQIGAAAFVSVSAPVITSTTASVTPALNGSFNGTSTPTATNAEIFAGASTDRFRPGQEIWVRLVVQINPNAATFPLQNQATASGRALDPADAPMSRGGAPLMATDASDSGDSFSDANAGAPGDTGGTADPTPVTCRTADIVITGNAAPICAGGSVTLTASTAISNVRYQWRRQTGTAPATYGPIVSTSATPTFSGLTAPTTYQLTLINDGPDCYYDLVKDATVTVNPAPTAAPSASYTAATDCSLRDLSLTANATGNATLRYAWTGPSGFTSTQANPVIANAEPRNNGTYALTVTDGNNCTVTRTVDVTTIKAGKLSPVVTSSGPACANGTVVLSVDQYTGSSVTYAWAKTTGATPTAGVSGQGTPELFLSPLDAATHAGEWTVTINVDGCTLSAKYTVVVYAQPTATATYSNATPVCSGDAITITGAGTGSAPLSYAWAGPNGFSASVPTLNLTNVDVSRNGLYTLAVTSANGCKATASTTVSNVKPTPVTPDLTVTSAVCAGSSITLSTSTVVTGAGTGYAWTKDGVVVRTTTGASANSTTFAPADASYGSGDWQVTVTNADGCKATSAAKAIRVNPIPSVTASAGPATGPNAGASTASGTNVCAGSAVALYASNVPGATYRWYNGTPGPGTLVTLSQNPTISGLAAGTYTYQVQVTVDGCVSPSSSTTFTIASPPAIAPSPSYTVNGDCSAATLTLNANLTAGSGTAPYGYAWTGPKGFSASVANPTVPNANASNNGSYTLTVTDANGCTSTRATTINTIPNQPQQPQVAVNNATACAGQEIVLTGTNYTGGSVSYSWEYDPDGFANPALPLTTTIASSTGQGTSQLSLKPATAASHNGEYRLRAVVDGCTNVSAPVAIAVATSPTVAPTATTGTICTGGSLQLTAGGAGGATYAWTGPNGFTSTAPNPLINPATVDNNGTYTVVATNAAGCRSAAASVVVNNVRATPARPTVTGTSVVCNTGNIVLAANESYAGTVTYRWTNGAGTQVATTAGLTLSANAATAISPFRLAVTSDGCTAPISEPFTVTIERAPTISASNNGPVCRGQSVTLTAGTVANATYAWRVNGTATVIGTDRVLTVAPSATQTYELTVTSNSCGAQSTTTAVVVNAPNVITAAANYTLNADCSPADLTLSHAVTTAGSAGLTGFAWKGPNGFTSNVASPVIRNATAANNGTYSLVATDANGCTSAASVDVTTVTDAQSKPQITSSGPACADGNVTLAVASYSGSSVSYVWEYDSNGFATAGGNTILANFSGQNTARLVLTPISATDNAGEYRVRVTVDGCALQSDPVAVVVFPQPAATATHTIVTACDPGDVQFATTGVSNVASYAWTGPNGFTSNISDPNIFPATAANNGTYRLTVTSVSGCTSASTTTVSGLLPPAATPELFVDEVCAGGSLVFTTPTIGTSFDWIGPDGLVKATTTASPASTSSLTIASTSANYLPGAWKVRVTDANGCIATSPAETATIKPVPLATTSGNGPICLGAEAVFSVDAVAGATYNWYSTSSSTVSLSQNRTLAVNGLAVGTQTRYVEVSVNGCTSAPTAASVLVNGQPTSAPTASYTTAADCSPKDLQLTANASAGTSPYTYAWSGPNGFTSTQASPLIANAKPANNGSYALVVTDANGCRAAATSVQVNNISSGVAQPAITANGPVCAGATALLSTQAYSGSSVTYSWSLTSGSPATTTTAIPNASGQGTRQLTINPAAAASAGQYTVTINVDGCVLTSPAYTLVVNARPTLAPSFTYAATGNCSANDLSLTAGGTPAAGSTYAWTGPNAFTSTATNPTITAATASANGTYQVTVTSGNGCATTDAVTVSGVRSGVARPIVASSGPACVGGQVQLSVPAYSGSNVTYAWTIPAAATHRRQHQRPEQQCAHDPSARRRARRQLQRHRHGGRLHEHQRRGRGQRVLPHQYSPRAPLLASSVPGGNLQLTAGGSGCDELVVDRPGRFCLERPKPAHLRRHLGAPTGPTWSRRPTSNGCVTTASVAVNNVRDQPTTPIINSNGPVCETGTIQLSSATAYTGTVTYACGPTATASAIPVANGGQTAIASFPANATFAVSPYRLQVTVDACAAPISAALPVQVDKVPVATAANTGPVLRWPKRHAHRRATSPGRATSGAPGGTLVSTDRSFTVSAIAATATYSLTIVRGELRECGRHHDGYRQSGPERHARLRLHPRRVPARWPTSRCAPILRARPPPPPATPTAGRVRIASPLPSVTPSSATRGRWPTAATRSWSRDGSSAACAKTFTVEVSGVVAPVDKPVVTASGQGCEGGVVTLSVPAYPGTGVTYAWSTPAGTTQDISGANTNVLRISTTRAGIHAGDYSVTVIVDGCPATADAYALAVTPRPDCPPRRRTTPWLATAPVSGFDLMANGNWLRAAQLRLEWAERLFAANSATPRIDRATGWASNGSYTVTVTDANGCTASGSVQVSGVREPVAKPQIASTGDACAGGNIMLSVPGLQWLQRELRLDDPDRRGR